MPGGGEWVRLSEPNGYQIEVVHGQSLLDPTPVRYRKSNVGRKARTGWGELMRIHTSASRVKQIRQGVLGTPKVMDTVKWFRETLGLLRSDGVYARETDYIISSFNRCDQGEDYVGHRALFCIHNERARLNDLSFGIHDIDDVFTGHEHLRRNGYPGLWLLG